MGADARERGVNKSCTEATINLRGRPKKCSSEPIEFYDQTN